LTFPRFIIRPFLNAFCRLAPTNGRIRPESDGLAWILPYLLAKRNVLCVKISILSYQNFFFSSISFYNSQRLVSRNVELPDFMVMEIDQLKPWPGELRLRRNSNGDGLKIFLHSAQHQVFEV
jgi:hypothetical protein